MNMTELVYRTIMEMLEHQQGIAEIQRRELADAIGCVPSQINYVLTSRFTPEQGYIIESRRGGGGYIRIQRVKMDRTTAIMHVINSVGDEIDLSSTLAILQGMVQRELISEHAAHIIAASMGEACYREIPPQIRPRLRAAIFKQTVMAAASNTAKQMLDDE